MTMELWQCGATDLARMIRLGQVSSRESVTSCLARIDAVNPKINAIVRRMDAEALSAADKADAARKRGDVLGPLHGVPVTTKINTDQKGLPTDNGVVALKDLIATEDAPIVANLRRAGAIFIGRTNAPAFSTRAFSENDLHGRTHNPLDRSITPGGSSGGAAAAVAVGFGPIAQGNDLGGSIRFPASCNGVIGLRVGLGRIPAFNTTAKASRPIAAQLMSAQGSITRTVRDARLALSVMAKGDPRDTRWANVPIDGSPVARPIHAAIVPVMPGGFMHPAQSEAVRTAGRHLANAGYVVEEVLPPEVEEAIHLFHIISSGDSMRAVGPQIEKFADAGAIRSFELWLKLAPAPSDANVVLDAFAQRDRLIFCWQEFFQKYPVIVMPILCDMPPPLDGDQTLDGQRRCFETGRAGLISPLLGLGGLAVPVGQHGPVKTGVQIITGRFREDLALDAGEIVEAAEGVVLPCDPTW
jgi:amidase